MKIIKEILKILKKELSSFDEIPSIFEFMQLENYLSDLLCIKVDLVMEKSY
jgi:predicted nucleotidyltransferase